MTETVKHTPCMCTACRLERALKERISEPTPLERSHERLLRLIEQAVEDDYDDLDPVAYEQWRAAARDAIRQAKGEA